MPGLLALWIFREILGFMPAINRLNRRERCPHRSVVPHIYSDIPRINYGALVRWESPWQF